MKGRWKYLIAPVVIIGAVLLLAVQVRADWPVEIFLPGHNLLYAASTPNGVDGTFVTGASLAGNNWDVWLFQLDDQANLVWSWEDSIYFPMIGNQYPLVAKSDGQGGCFLLVKNEQIAQPPRHSLLLWRINSSGVLLWNTVVRDSLVSTTNDQHLTIADDQVIISWYDSRSDSSGIWYRRINLVAGTPLDSNVYGRFLTAAYWHDVAQTNDSLLMIAGVHLYAVSLLNGEILGQIVGVNFNRVSMFLHDQQAFVLGNVGSRLLLVNFTAGNLLWTDTVATDLSGYLELDLVFHQGKLFLTYLRNFDLFGRSFVMDESRGLGSEILLTSNPGDQYHHRTICLDSTVMIVWYDQLTGSAWTQHLNNDYELHWLNGFEIGSVDPASPVPEMCFCDNGLLVRGHSSRFFVQPADNLSTEVTITRPILPAEFRFSLPFPNPCNSMVRLEYQLFRPTQVSLVAFNLLGQEIAVLSQGRQVGGWYQINWQPPAAGKYWLRLKTEHSITVRTIVFLP